MTELPPFILNRSTPRGEFDDFQEKRAFEKKNLLLSDV